MVAIKNNKGISLVDVIIAVVVMVLLLTPILLHTITSINTSAAAKEKQQVVDSATSVMEYFNQSSIEDIKSGTNVQGLVEIQNDSTHIVDHTGASAIVCNITVNGANVVGPSGPLTVKYNATDFIMDNIDLGRDHTNYERAVVMTDLANKLLEAGYRIKYDKTNKTTLDGVNYGTDKFEVLSDYSAVVYDDPNSITPHIIAVECVPADTTYTDPNTVSLGNIQDLDAKKIAIIEGDQTRLDKRFESDLVKRILDYASRHANVIDEAILENTTTLTKTITNLITAESNTFSRLIYISVVKKTDSSGKDFYNVKCDLSYYVEFGNENFKIFNNSNKGEITYNIMDKDFFTSEPPDVFLVYEPYITSFSANKTYYAYNDYICIKSDPYTSGYESGYDPSKVYIVKPTGSFQQSLADKTGEDQFQSGLTGDALSQARNMYYTKATSGFVPVNININQVWGNVVNADGSVLNYTENECLPLQVVTNMATYKSGSTVYPTGRWGTTDTGLDDSNQFSISLSNVRPNACLSGEGTRKAYPATVGLDTLGDEHKPLTENDGTVSDSIVTYMNDSNFTDKLYGITVTYKDPSGAKTYLTGAKGAD